MKINTINKKEIDKFSRIAKEWWNPEGKFKPLHKFNPIRISYIKKNIMSSLKLKNKNKPLNKVKILDIGCGGGLLSEPMCRLGAEVVGIDASDKNINIAKLHAKENNLNIKYFCASPETFKTNTKFDVILNMEIIEHVEDVDLFLKACSKHLKKNGIMFIATLNQTLKSYLFAIVGAEYILKWLPIGTHEWEKFIKPNDLVNILKKYDLRLEALDGMKYNLITDEWSISLDKSINYIGKFIKN
jgi:2-polyprenyl-6-hydroxyphenyl methylase/3-demethylubiquinone-9 3-methyltransferase